MKDKKPYGLTFADMAWGMAFFLILTLTLGVL